MFVTNIQLVDTSHVCTILFNCCISSFPFFLNRLPTPVEFRPGDSIVVNCTYQSTNQTSVVRWGESTSDEMCYAFLTYYPVNPQFSVCSNWRSVDYCSNIPDICVALISNVSGTCVSQVNCSRTCTDLMQTIVDTGCLTDHDYYLFMISLFSPEAAKGLTDLVSLCGISNPPISSTISSTTISSTTMRSVSSTVNSSGPNSAKRLSTGMKLIINTILPTLSFVLTLLFTA